jgi:hypothetical protein
MEGGGVAIAIIDCKDLGLARECCDATEENRREGKRAGCIAGIAVREVEESQLVGWECTCSQQSKFSLCDTPYLCEASCCRYSTVKYGFGGDAVRVPVL